MPREIASPGARAAPEPMKTDPKELETFLAIVKKEKPDALDVSERTRQMWLLGEVPKAIKLLLSRPDLALALWRDAERKALRKEARGDGK